MFKPAGMLLIAATLAAGCAEAPTEPAPAAAPAPVATPPPPAEQAPAPEPVPVAAPAPPPDEPPPLPARPQQTDKGGYRVCAASETSAKAAEAWVKKLEAQGLRVQTEPAQVGNATWQRVIVPGLANRADAAAMATWINQQFGTKDAWVIPKAKAAAPAAPAVAPAPAAAPAKAPAPKPAKPAKPAPAKPEPKVPDAEHPQN